MLHGLDFDQHYRWISWSDNYCRITRLSRCGLGCRAPARRLQDTSECMQQLETLQVTIQPDLPPSHTTVSVIHKGPGSTTNRGHPTFKGASSFRPRGASVPVEVRRCMVRSRPGWADDRAGRGYDTAEGHRQRRWTSYSKDRRRTDGCRSTGRRRGRWWMLEVVASQDGLNIINRYSRRVWHAQDLHPTPVDSNHHLRILRYWNVAVLPVKHNRKSHCCWDSRSYFSFVQTSLLCCIQHSCLG